MYVVFRTRGRGRQANSRQGGNVGVPLAGTASAAARCFGKKRRRATAGQQGRSGCATGRSSARASAARPRDADGHSGKGLPGKQTLVSSSGQDGRGTEGPDPR